TAPVRRRQAIVKPRRRRRAVGIHRPIQRRPAGRDPARRSRRDGWLRVTGEDPRRPGATVIVYPSDNGCAAVAGEGRRPALPRRPPTMAVLPSPERDTE